MVGRGIQGPRPQYALHHQSVRRTEYRHSRKGLRGTYEMSGANTARGRQDERHYAGYSRDIEQHRTYPYGERPYPRQHAYPQFYRCRHGIAQSEDSHHHRLLWCFLRNCHDGSCMGRGSTVGFPPTSIERFAMICLHAYIKSSEMPINKGLSLISSLHKAYIKPTQSLHEAYIKTAIYGRNK